MDQTRDRRELKEQLQQRLGYRFADPALLELALTHRSWKMEQGGGDNERLEYLGDAVLELVVTEHLVDRFPEAAEGPLSKARARLVRASTLANLGRSWGLGELLLMGRGEVATGGANKESLLANAVEALLGAVYRDAGLAPCRCIIEEALNLELDEVDNLKEFGADPKSVLQELTAREWRVKPKYLPLETTGPAHQRRFHVEVVVNDIVAARGWGGSKREAQREAAAAALAQLRAKIAAEE